MDFAVVFIISLLTFRGLWTGFVRQAAFIAALILAYLVAGAFSRQCAVLFKPFSVGPQFSFLLTYGLLFVGVYLAVTFAGVGLKQVLKISMLGGLDRLLGGLFGLGKGVFFATLLFMALAASLSNSAPYLRRSHFYRFLNSTSMVLVSCISDHDLRRGFRPREPAISSLFAEDSFSPPGDKRGPALTADQRREFEDLRYQLAREYGAQPQK